MKLSDTTEINPTGQGVWTIQNQGERIHLKYKELANLALTIVKDILDEEDKESFHSLISFFDDLE